jgi:uncharacterized membrane protein
MTKYEWERELRNNLKRLPEAEVSRVLDYYDELFEDKVEEGMSEKEIVKRFGNPFDVAYKILYDSGADGGNGEEAAVRPPEPFVPYGGASANRERRRQTYAPPPQSYYAPPPPAVPPQNYYAPPPAAPQANPPAETKKSGGIIARLIFFIPFVIVATVAWSLVVGVAAGGIGAVVEGVLLIFTGFAISGEGLVLANVGGGLAAVGLGILLCVATVHLVKFASRMTQKYFYMGKHKTKGEVR